ncbi:MAG TPA: ELWxxDGT repeat protein [Thermoanaerobaculia bacterium]|nr:ELWxxDGT repeat protein [Thermoanaerobaculia bacterium]
MKARSLALAVLALLPALLAAAWAQPASMVLDVGDTAAIESPLGLPQVQFGAGFPEGLPVELDGALYFHVNDGIHGYELWRSDGTAAGTFILSDLCSGICSSGPLWLTAFQHKLYWTACSW